jgi:MFS family permease
VAGFTITTAGILLIILLAQGTTNVLAFAPGLFLVGFGIGIMLTMSVNVVQSAFPEHDQGDISGVSRSVSNLGSSLGTSIVGSVLVVSLLEGNKNFALALIVMVVFSCIGLIASILLPAMPRPSAAAGNTGVKQQAAT